MSTIAGTWRVDGRAMLEKDSRRNGPLRALYP